MRGSARRSRLGLGVANWDFPSLGIFETNILTKLSCISCRKKWLITAECAGLMSSIIADAT